MSVPVSRRPRRLASVIMDSNASAITTRDGQSDGKAEAMASTPAVRLTAAVSR